MSVESFISFLDQFTIKPHLAAARFVSGNKQHVFAFGVEGEGNAPYAIAGSKAEFFQIRMARPLSVYRHAAVSIAVQIVKKASHGKQLVLNICRQFFIFGLKLIADLNHPFHSRLCAISHMESKTYVIMIEYEELQKS